VQHAAESSSSTMPTCQARSMPGCFVRSSSMSTVAHPSPGRFPARRLMQW
jgi:hypothetical protein